MSQEFVFSQKCPFCNKSKLVIDQDKSEVYCKNCGVVLEERLESNNESVIKSNEKQNTRTFAGLANYDSLTTIIDSANTDAYGNSMSTSMKINFERLRIWDKRTKTLKEIQLRRALNELSSLKDKLSLSDSVVEDAAYIYRQTVEKKLIRGRSVSTMVAASAYAACRKRDIPRTLKDISVVSGLPEKTISMSYRIIIKELNLKIPVQDATYWINKIASVLQVNEKIVRNSMDITRLAITKEISAGKHPVAIAATALYAASMNVGYNLTQKQIADAANITEVTIRNRMKNLLPLLQEL